MDAFYVPEGHGFVSTELTRGPWDPGSQHAGPPAALLGRALEALPAGGDDSDAPSEWQLGRITFELLRAIPIAPLAVRAQVLRPGRSVELVEARLEAGGEEVMRATGWRLRQAEVDIGVRPAGVGAMPPGPDRGEAKPFFPTGQEVGYHTAMDYRFVAGEFIEPGPATTWMRMRHPLIAGEEPSPLVRVLIAADTGNGISAALDFHRFVFINVDLTVHLHRLPAGEWVCLDAATVPEQNGIGVCDSALYDEHGRIGRALQTLLVRERR